MHVRAVGSAAELGQLAEPLLARDPVGLTVVATSLERARRWPEQAGDVLWWVAAQDGEPVAVGHHWPPHRVGLQGVPATLASDVGRGVAALVRDASREPVGVVGPPAAAEAFGRAWTAEVGGTAHVTRRQRLHELGRLVAPVGVAGSARPVEDGDAELVAGWAAGFLVDIGDLPGHDAAGIAARLLTDPQVRLWLRDGAPVSLAAARPPVAGVSRVGPVYTPPEHRGRGYASAVTAEVTRLALAAGAERVCLYTDLANPTSNAIYARLGYRPVQDEVELTFTP